MLQLTIPSIEHWDSENNEFVYSKECTLQLEHSLVSLSKWESKWCKPFLTRDSKTEAETIDYIRCMTLTQNINQDIYPIIPAAKIAEVNDYIDLPMTATTFQETKKSLNREIITSEIIYYWMIALNIPFDCQKWHLNRLLTLINVCNVKNKPPTKMNRRDMIERNNALNAARRNSLNTKG